MPVIYIDVLLALNLFIDFLLLSVTARIRRRPHRRWRTVLGALFGAACSCLIFLPDMPPVLSVAVKLVMAAVIVLIAYPWAGISVFLKDGVVFFVCSTAFAGLSLALWFFAAPQGFYVVNGVVYYDVSPLTLVALTVVSYGILWIWDRVTRKKAPLGGEYRLTLDYGMGPVSVRALLDTGNHLTEVFSGSPVAVVRREAVESALPSSVLAAARCAHAGETPPDGAANPQAAARDSGIRLVPYRSVGGKGLLPAFRPQSASLLSSAGISRDVTGIYTALCGDLGRGGYDALIGSDLAELTGQNASKPSEGQDKRG